jgi:alpha-glucosidase
LTIFNGPALTPFFVTPMLDFGYDTADCCAVDPVFGTLEDFDRLAGELHSRDIKLILDIVPNHTSNRHAWFADSRPSRESAKRYWYVWADPSPNGGAPNGLDGSAAAPGAGMFVPQEQPDLNWRNPEVRRVVADVLRFWMRRAADGFRVDALNVKADREDRPCAMRAQSCCWLYCWACWRPLAGMLMQACRLLANSFVPTITLRWGSARSPR